MHDMVYVVPYALCGMCHTSVCGVCNMLSAVWYVLCEILHVLCGMSNTLCTVWCMCICICICICRTQCVCVLRIVCAIKNVILLIRDYVLFQHFGGFMQTFLLCIPPPNDLKWL